MAHANSYRYLTAAARIPSQASPRGISGRQRGTGTGFLRELRFSSVGIIPPILNTHISLIS
jgi:hypothetical protein